MHKRLGARLTAFAGWDMPLHYSGVIAEHQAVRSSVGIFDVSHLGKLRLTGPGAGGALQEALTADVMALEQGRASYSLVLNEEGGCLDDVFVYRLGAQEWLVVPNAANVEAVADSLRSSGGEPTDEWDRWAVLAVQGPDSFDLVDRAWPAGGATQLRLHSWGTIEMFGDVAYVARTGYTGERGFELYVPSGSAVAAFERLLALGGTPVGLGARDTLRLEMGYALYGHELTTEINPLEAGLEWTLAWRTPFRGRERLERVRAEGPARKIFGIVCSERGIPRQGHAVYSGDTCIGTVTSGNYSPTLGRGIALALGAAATTPAIGEQVEIEGRGRRITGAIVNTPFIRRQQPGGSRVDVNKSTSEQKRG